MHDDTQEPDTTSNDSSSATGMSQATNARLAVLIESMQAAVLVEDEDRRLVLVNQAFCRMFQIPLPPAALIGADCAAAAEQSKALFCEPTAFISGINRTIEARTVVSAERLELLDGRIFERDYVPIFLDDQYRGHLWQYRDVSERERTTAELIRARDAAEAADRAKSVFLAMISHEIRTPLNAVIGMSGLLLDTKLTPEQHEYAAAIRRSGDMLFAMINNVLDLSKIEADHMQIEREPFSPRSCIESCVSVLESSAVKQSLILRAEVDPEVPAYVLGDLQRTRQVLINLISNAIKFTEAGSVSVRLRTVSVEDGITLIFVVADTGIGMTADQLGRLFQPFQQFTSGASRQGEGVGLGLVICHRLTKLMGGTLTAESTPGRGSIFTFTLPTTVVRLRELRRQREDAHMRNSLQAARRAIPKRSLRVLVAEDNELNQQVMIRMLARSGYQADLVSNGMAALQMLRDRPYDVVLMDVQMPELDGLEVTRRVRAELSPDRQPYIIAVTASAILGDRERCLAAGMNAYLSKPIQRMELEQLLDAIAPPLTGDGDAVEEPLLNHNIIDELREALGGNEAFYPLLDMFAQDFRSSLAEIQMHAAAGEFVRVSELAHRLKGSALALGAERLAGLCRHLEGSRENPDPTAVAADLQQLEQRYLETIKVLRDVVSQ